MCVGGGAPPLNYTTFQQIISLSLLKIGILVSPLALESSRLRFLSKPACMYVVQNIIRTASIYS